ncbi:MAG: protein translocase subunit SecD [Gemmatimonadetes bacterium]|nr:protein translocase subunit SecD [Gemmatimonadota bacterium]MYB71103.1 protein translocase subunit SecD [Gemmatimonadota bacterium]
MKRNRRLVLIVALIAAAVYYLLPSVEFYSMADDEREAMELKSPGQLVDLKKRSLNLGLDLQGGIHLVLEVKTEGMEQQEAQDAVAQAQEVIRNRVDQFGVAEPTIQRQGENRIIIELPGVQDVQRAKDLVGQTALLEFQLLEPAEDRTRLIQRIDQVLAPQKEEEEEEEDLLLSSTAENTPLSSMLSGAGEDLTVSGRDLQRVKNLLNAPEAQDLIPADMEFLFSSKPAGAEGNEFYFLYLVRKKPEMTGHMIQDAFVSIGQVVEYMGQPIVNFSTTDEGVRLFSRITGSHIGERMAIVLDESVYSAPVIQNKISEGRGIITGSGTQEEAKDLAIVLRAGALPAEVEIIEDRTVGPSLGRDSIEQGKTAAIYSMVLVVIFMVLYYRAAGLIADCALLLNMLFIMAVLAGFHATLTLPGIAGIILTIGMAVDANVLIFERIREELRSGKTVRAAIDSGYGHALSAIIDANVTTFLVGIVLYQFGTGPIRGFALTLCIGIVSSLFTAFFVTRTIFDLITRRSEQSTLSIGPVGLFSNLNIRFLSLRNIGFGTSAAVLLIGIVSILGTNLGTNGIRKGIDFAGGTLLELHFDPAVQVEDIRSQLGRVPVGDAEIDLSKSEIKQFGSENDILIRVSESGAGTEVADGIMGVLKAGFVNNIEEMEWIRRQEKVGPKIGSELSDAAVRAVLVALALILIYMAWRFHRFLYGIAAVVALFHDVLITLGLLSLFDIEITLAVVAALLAIVGYSLNDTIVVFDRIRENLHTARRQGFDGTVNQSINECLSRTLITSATTLMAVLVLMIFGGEVNRDFTITLMIGVVVGTYSSVFVASPVLYLGQQRAAAKGSD